MKSVYPTGTQITTKLSPLVEPDPMTAPQLLLGAASNLAKVGFILATAPEQSHILANIDRVIGDRFLSLARIETAIMELKNLRAAFLAKH